MVEVVLRLRPSGLPGREHRKFQNSKCSEGEPLVPRQWDSDRGSSTGVAEQRFLEYAVCRSTSDWLRSSSNLLSCVCHSTLVGAARSALGF